MKITEDGVDFGGSTWSLGQPIGPAAVDGCTRRTAYVTPQPHRRDPPQQLVGRVRADEPPLPDRGRARSSPRGPAARSARPTTATTRGASTSTPYDSTEIGQVQVQLQTLGDQRHLRHGRLADGLDQRVTASAGLGIPKEFPTPLGEGATDGPPSRTARRLAPRGAGARGRRGGLRRALRPPPQAAAVVLPAHAGQRRRTARTRCSRRSSGRTARCVAGQLPDAVRPWLFAIARNRCKTMLAARREATVPVEDVEPSFDGLVRRRRAARRPARARRRPRRGCPRTSAARWSCSSSAGCRRPRSRPRSACPAGKVKALVFQARTELMAERDARLASCDVDPRGARGRARRRAAARAAEAPPAPVRAVRRVPRGGRRAAHGPRVDPAGRPGARTQGRDPPPPPRAATAGRRGPRGRRARRRRRPRRRRGGARRRRRRARADAAAAQRTAAQRRRRGHGAAQPAAASAPPACGRRGGRGTGGAAQRRGQAARPRAAQRPAARPRRRRGCGGAVASGARGAAASRAAAPRASAAAARSRRWRPRSR